MLHDEAVQGSKSSRGAAAPPLDMAFRRLPARSTLVRATRERMRRRLRLGDHLVDLRLPLEGALDRFLHRPIVEVVDLLVVLRLPVDENPHQDAVVVHFVPRDDARGHAVHHRARDRRLRRQVGVTTASSLVKPSVLFANVLTKACPAWPDFDPMIRSMWATSFPSPTRDSPRKKSAAITTSRSGWGPRVSLAGRHECGVESSVARGVWKATPSRVCG